MTHAKIIKGCLHKLEKDKKHYSKEKKETERAISGLKKARKK